MGPKYRAGSRSRRYRNVQVTSRRAGADRLPLDARLLPRQVVRHTRLIVISARSPTQETIVSVPERR